jgi:hypothetical protein
MIPDSEGVHEIANTHNPDRKADIVFVHGLGGSSHSTWRYGMESEDRHFFWPEELGRDLPVVVKGVVAFVSFAKPLLSIPESLDLCSFWCD